jgi:hypothetical protein
MEKGTPMIAVSHAASQHPTDWFPLITALVGVAFGFLLKTGYDWLVERSRADKEFRAAVLLVSDELRANVVKLEIALETAEDPEPLASHAYDTYQLILARRLPPEARDAVRGVYIHARVHRAFQVISNRPSMNPGRQRVASTPVVQEALDKARRAREMLRPYIPKGTAEI